MAKIKELDDFIAAWQADPLNLRPAFIGYAQLLESLPDVETSFKARPGITYSLRGKGARQQKRDLFVMVDVVDDDPDGRWLSVCFYADLVSDPDEIGDFVPSGLNDEDAMCFNLDQDDAKMRDYIAERIREAAKNAA